MFKVIKLKFATGTIQAEDARIGEEEILTALKAFKEAANSILLSEAKEQLSALAASFTNQNTLLSKGSFSSIVQKNPKSAQTISTPTSSDKPRKPIQNNHIVLHNKTGKPVSGKTMFENLKTTLDRSKLNVNIKGVNTNYEDKIVIHLNSKSDQDILEAALSKQKDNSFETSVKKDILPRVIIIGVDNQTEPETIIKHLAEKFPGENNLEKEIKIIRRTRGNGTTPSIILETPSHIFPKILSLGRIFLDWTSHKIERAHMVSQCFKCSSLKHTSMTCNESPICPRCAESHTLQDCKAPKYQQKCCNCSKASLTPNNHQANSLSCPLFKEQSDLFFSKFNDRN